MQARNSQRGHGRWLAFLLVVLVAFLGLVRQSDAPPQAARQRHGQPLPPALAPARPAAPMATTPMVAGGAPTKAAASAAIARGSGDPAPPPGQPEIAILSSTLRETLAEIRFPAPVLTPMTHRGRQVVAVDMPGSRPLKEANQPALPVNRWDVILPVNAQASLEIVSIDDETVPSLPPIPSAGFGRRPDPLPAGDFGKAYASRQPFPAQVARLTPTYQIRQLRGTGIVIHPVRYLPAAQALQVIRSVRLRVRYTPAMPGGTISHPPRPRSSAFRALANSRFENYEAMVTTTTAAATRADGSLQNSDKLLVLVPDAWAGVQDDFVRWKRQRGLTVSVAGYPSDTGEGVPALTSYLQTAYDNNQITYVLLIGDEDAIPHGEGDQKGGTPSDTVYTLVAGADHYHDLLISRISTPTSPRAGTLLAKAIAYERDPNTADGWRARATMVASSQTSTTSVASPYYGKADYEQLGALRTLLLASGLFDSVAEAYQGADSGTSARVSSAWNAGHGLLYYLGHGSATTWISVPYGTTDVEALANGTALPFVINGACVNGAFQYSSPCLAEAMLWGNTANGADGSGGAIAVISSTTNMDWDPPIAMLDAFTGYYLGSSEFTVGDQDLANQPMLWDASSLAFASIQRAMDYCASANGDGQDALELIMQQTHLFGDCTLGVRTVTPRVLVAAHADTVSPGTGLEVTVNTPGRGPVAAATVTLTDAAGNMSTAVTDVAGMATVPATAFVPGDTVTLTVYERNSLPYQQADLPVGDGTVVILASSQPPTGFQGEAYSHTFTAVSGTPPYSWSVAAGTLPPGMSLTETTGEFSGNPSTAGDFTFTVQVADASAEPDQDQMPVGWTVGQAVQIPDQGLAKATVGTAFSASVTATGSFPPFTFSLVDGSLPPGLSLASDGTVAGTPTRQGSHTFTLQATDAAGRTDEAAVGITVAPAAAVTILTTDLADATIGIAYSAQLAGAGGSGGGYVWELAAGTLPTGLTLAANGMIEGTATTHGTTTFTVRLTDDAIPPRTTTQEFSLLVGQPVTITTTALPPATAGLAYSNQITATGNYFPFTFTTIGGTTYTQQTTDSTFVEGGTLRTDWYGDETHHDLDLGFAFPYFGQTYTSCEVGDNGYLVFGGDGPTTGLSGDCWDATANQFATFHMIAPFWSDLLILEEDDGTGIWLTQTANSVTIRWRGLDYHDVPGGDGAPDLVNMAVTIHASGQIVFSYGTIQTTNRVIIGLSNGGDPDSTILYEHAWNQYDPDYVTGWSEAADRVFVPQGLVPPGLSLSATGLLSGIPAEPGTYGFTVQVADTDGNVDQATLALEVRENMADTNGDGDIDNGEILAYIERWQAGEVPEAEVETAVQHWQLGPPASRQGSRSAATASPRSSLVVTFGDRATLDRLVDRGLIITSVHGNQAHIHATAEEQAWLEGLGLPTVAAASAAARAAPDTYAALAAELQTMADNHPTICRIEQLGTSVNGRGLLALVISDFPHTDEDEPEVRIVGGIHGDERLSATLSFRLADWLLTNYGGTDADGVRATALVDATELWVLPMLNPDGWEADTRENGNGQDLNRSFPDGIVNTVGTVFAEGAPDTSGREPETAAFMAWTAARRFTLGATFHTGAKLVCYPYGNRQDGASLYSATPDDALFIGLSHAYVDNHPDMATEGTVVGGIINSCEWYRVLGELPDWAYRYAGSLEVTVELDTADAPQEDPAWADNQESMLAFIQYAQRGIRGIVRDAATGTPLAAAIQITGNSREVYTDPDAGDYHRVLLPGTYSVTVSAPGYLPQTATGVVVAGETATRLDLDLTPDTGQHRLYRSFPTVLYTPDAANSVALEVDVDEAFPPSAFIVAETLPDGWVYQANSAVDAGSGDALASPRTDGQTVSWLFWRTGVHDRQLGYTALAPQIRSDTAVFGGTLVTATRSAATSGDITWLAQTGNRFGLELAAGWNLISLPLEPADSRPASLFGESSGIAVWDWDCTALRYRVPSLLKAKDAYWVHAPEPADFIIEGNAPPDDNRDFAPGWNLFGPLDDRPLLDETFFRGDTVEWSGYSYGAASSLLRCRGYWIRAALPGRASLR